MHFLKDEIETSMKALNISKRDMAIKLKIKDLDNKLENTELFTVKDLQGYVKFCDTLGYGFRKSKVLEVFEHLLHGDDDVFLNQKIAKIPKISNTLKNEGFFYMDKIAIKQGFLRAMKVPDYDMIPVLSPDGYVIFDNANDYVGDGLYVIKRRNTLVIREIRAELDGRLQIIAINHKEISEIRKDDIMGLEIFGKIVRSII